MRSLLYFVTLGVIFFAQAASSAQSNKLDGTSEAAIRAVLNAQRDAWNRGDIEGYMEGYDRSPDTVFVSGDRINRGWQMVLDRYKKSYDSREQMGVLTFSAIEITMLSKDAAVVVGGWRLDRAIAGAHGTFP